uniref:54S ribosomal protein MRP49, mitochondrial n=1 Tax=Lygus hesperus TaxID=30085 RepID=A0A0A9W8X1_LYGHE
MVEKHKPFTKKLDFERTWILESSLAIKFPNLTRCTVNSTYHPEQYGVRNFVRTYLPTLRYHNPRTQFVVHKRKDSFCNPDCDVVLEIATATNKTSSKTIDCRNKSPVDILAE